MYKKSSTDSKIKNHNYLQTISDNSEQRKSLKVIRRALKINMQKNERLLNIINELRMRLLNMIKTVAEDDEQYSEEEKSEDEEAIDSGEKKRKRQMRGDERRSGNVSDEDADIEAQTPENQEEEKLIHNVSKAKLLKLRSKKY